MKRKWLPLLFITAFLTVWLGCSLAIRAALPAQLTKDETALLREAVADWWGIDDGFYSDVLYDSQGTPMWMYGESEGGSVVLDRITQSFAEAGEQRYYRDYHDARKYYAAPLGHIVEAKDVPDDIDSADEGYFFMGPNRHLDSFSPGVIGWLWSNLKLPAQTLKSLISGNSLPIGK